MTNAPSKQIPTTMKAMVTMGHGGMEMMVYHED